MVNKKLVGILQGSKKYLYLNLLFRFVALFMQIGIVCIFGEVISKVFSQKVDDINLIRIFIYGFTFVLVKLFCQYMVTRISFSSTKFIKEKMRKIIFDKLMDDGIDFEESLPTSSILQLAVEGVDQLEIYFTSYIPQLYYSLSSALILFACICFISVNAAITLLICLPLIPVSIILIQKIAKKLLGSYWTSYMSLADIFLENLEGINELKSYGADSYRQDLMDDFAEKFRKATMRVLVMQLNSTSVMDIIAYGGAAAGIGVALMEFSQRDINIFGLVFISLLAAEFFLPLRLLGSYFHIAMNGIAASNKLMVLIDSRDRNLGGESLQAEKIDLGFDNLSFSYDGLRQILDDINIEIKTGDLVSLVGLSGSGKSTLAKLIKEPGLAYDGKILINGKEKKSYNPISLNKKIINVDFDGKVFKGSLRENLSIAGEDITDEKMLEALKKVNLYDFFMGEDGLDTEILENASNISGGQRQRLVLARAFLFDGLLYIFDEATSNIDGPNEAKIMKIIQDLAKEKAVLIISHKLINLVNSDRIYFLADGKIQNSGSHAYLYESCEAYKNIFDKQEELCSYAKGVAYEN
ncbi:ABC transporter ATP-binding protein/permease [uncultured Anaerococcus sp.]|uniref:ABC transporter ATP-binding protein/permease n=1 Tax=uncultured Anaerococcus sp. TaxID=293428 RepID=UPI00288ACB69|nr:ABC transporter ATP-binding protein/permease [uncultured Anaerococcus sp.]